jgi:hypothetical protein
MSWHVAATRTMFAAELRLIVTDEPAATNVVLGGGVLHAGPT